jgi:hypothetical protein
LCDAADGVIFRCLRPVRPKAMLKKEHGVWVYQGETTNVSITDLIDREREKRSKPVLAEAPA